MKKLVAVTLLAIITSCGGNKSENAKVENILADLSYSVDTVVVDAGDEFFNLSRGIRSFALTEDKKRLFYFENRPPKLVEIDLDNLKLVSKTDFDEEGPDGIGNFIAQIAVGSQDQVFALGMGGMGLFDKNGKKLEDLKVNPKDLNSNLTGDFISFFVNSIYDFSERQFYSWPISETSEGNALYKVDVESESAEVFELPEFEIAETYSLQVQEGNNYMYFPQQVLLMQHDGQVYISCSATSGIYKLDKASNQLEFIEINHHLVSNKLTGAVNNNLSSEKEFRDELRKIQAQISYMNLTWDPTRNMFLRLGSRTFLGENREDPSTIEMYLFAYDQDLKLLGETKIEGLTKLLSQYFFKDGKLWAITNVEDELGFAVYTFDF